MHDPNHTAPAEACSPDPDRAGADASRRLPERLVHMLALLIHFLRCHFPHDRAAQLPVWWHGQPILSLASAPALAASVRGAFGNHIAWTCRRRSIGPRNPDWLKLSRAIVVSGRRVKGFRASLPACGIQWRANPAIVPGMIGMAKATPAANASASVAAARGGHTAASTHRSACQNRAGLSAAPRRHILAGAATVPPAG